LRIVIAVGLAVLVLLPSGGLHAGDPSPSTITLLRDNQFFHVLRDHIADATEEIVVCMFLFKTNHSSSNRASMILDGLVTAKKRGIDVRVLLERTDRHHDSLNRHNTATSKQLRQHGVGVLFDSPETTTHTKTIVIDKRFVFIGSHNLTHSALFYNHELSVMIDDRNLAEDVLKYLKNLES
jgi:phosphatidylserine/phosphatidylglycerophosphate/cardiolipin synthase-like enzyme